MELQKYQVIGVMSGTSLDGIDLAEIHFIKYSTHWAYNIGAVSTVPYSESWANTLQQTIHFPLDQVHRINEDYSLYLSKIIAEFIQKNELTPDLIASHGHTIFHQPKEKFTLQLGNLPSIKTFLKEFPVVCDFRKADVQMGGQGAPLVPIGDAFLFPSYKYCVNLGGFSNLSFSNHQHRLAFDICPVNIVLNHYANQMGLSFDTGGKIAAQGKLNLQLLKALNANAYFTLAPPKSLGYEFVLAEVFPLIDSFALDIPDILHTYVHHIAYQIASNCTEEGAILLTGGGAYHHFLIHLLQDNLPTHQIVVPDSKTIEYKEALIFALLGVLKWRGENNVLASVTGAPHDHCSGIIYN